MAVMTNRDFRLLWGGQIISQLGDAFNMVAALFAVMEMTNNSALAISGIMACEYIPALLVGLWAGVFVDRWNYRRIMIISDIIRAVFAGTMLLWFYLKWLPGVFFTVIFLGSIGQFFNPAKSAILIDIVDGDDLLQANSLTSSTQMLIGTLGTAFGAALYALLGKELCFLSDAFSFVISAASIILIRYTPKTRTIAAVTWENLKAEFKAGFSYVNSSVVLKALFVGYFTCMLGGGVMNVLGAKFVTDVLHLAKEYYGFGGIFIGAGAAIASAGTAILSKRLKPASILCAGLVLCGLAISIMAGLPTMLMSVFMLLVLGIGNVLLQIGGNTLVQRVTSDEYRGRVFGLIGPIVTLGVLTSAVFGGFLTQFIGLRSVVIGSGLIVIASAAVVGLKLIGQPIAFAEPEEQA